MIKNSEITLQRSGEQKTATVVGEELIIAEMPNESPVVSSKSSSANASTRGLFRNALSSYLVTFIGMTTGAVMTPLLVHHLGNTQFGLWVLLVSTIGYTGLLEVGLQTTVAKRVADCLALNDQERLKQVLGTAFAMYLGFAVVVLVVTGILVAVVGRLFHLSAHDTTIAQDCLLVLGFNQAVAFIFSIQSAALFGAGRIDLSSISSMIVTVGVATANILLVIHNFGIIALACVTLSSTIVGGFIVRYALKKNLPEIAIQPRLATRLMARELLKYGSRNATLSVAGTIAFCSDALIIGLLLPVSSIAQYAIASRVVNLVNTLATKPISVLLPAYAHAESNQEIERQWHLFTESVTISIGIALPFVASIEAFGPRIIEAWVGPHHSQSAEIAAVLALAFLFAMPGYACSSIMTATEKNLLLVRIYVVAAIANLALSYTLTAKIGPVGVADGSLITTVVVDFIMLPIIVCHQLHKTFQVYLVTSFKPILLPLVVSTLVSWALVSLRFPPERILAVAMIIIVTLITWLFLLVALPVTRRQFYLKSFRLAFRR